MITFSSQVDQLILKLCPNGVEFKTLGEIGTLIRGSGLQKSDFTESGVGCIHYGQIYTYYKLFTKVTKSFVSPEISAKLKKVRKGDLVIACTSENIQDVCKAVVWLGDDEIVTGGHSTIYTHKQNPMYIAYFFQSQDFFDQKKKYAKGTKVIEVSAKELAKIRIPLPPLEIQNEIVSILGKFTELEAELEAELETRKKQYKHYRKGLLIFGDDIEWKELREVGTIFNGRAYKQEELLEEGKYKVLRVGNFFSSNKWYYSDLELEGNKYCDNGDLLYAWSASFGPKIWNGGKTIYHYHIWKIINKENINRKFLFYLLVKITQTIKEDSGHGSTMIHVTKEKFEKIKLPIPSLKEQERIVSLLDKFDALVNDISIGLPAEIKARKQQYEYYRNKLLTFKEYDPKQ